MMAKSKHDFIDQMQSLKQNCFAPGWLTQLFLEDTDMIYFSGVKQGRLDSLVSIGR